ncbi:MAG: hypothetical protein WAQ98_16790 [Blastocatellia bacterium]
MNDNQQKPNVKKPLLVKKNNTANNQLSAPAKAPVKASPTLANTNATTQAKPVTKTSNAPKPITPTTQATLVKGATPAKVVAKTPPPITKTPSQQPSQPLSKTSPQPKQPAQVVKAVKAVSIAPVAIERAIADETLTKAQMDITVKISELPSEVNTNEQGVKEFYVKANEREVFIAISSKQYNKLVTAQQTWPSWIGRIAGKLGQATKDGFILDKANVQVFERIIKVVEPAKTGNEKQVSNMQADRKASDEPAITHRKYKEICKLFDPYLEKGKLPTQEEIARLLAPYNLDRREINQLLNRLLGRNHLKRETGFLIEKTYFKLLGEWDSNYFQLVTKVANELEMNEKAVATWLGFIHQPHGVIRRIALPLEEIIEQVIKLYQQYLEGEEPPKSSLHNWISENMTEPLDTNTIHKVVADYREKLKKNKFGNRVKPKQLLLDAATENNDKTNNNEISNNGNSAITNDANNNQIAE